MPIKLLSLVIFSLLFLSFKSKAADKNYPSFITASKVTIIDDELGKAKNFADLHLVLMKIGEIVSRNFGDTCKEPNTDDYRLLCAHAGTWAKAPLAEIEFYEYAYDMLILKLSCVDIRIDNEETVKQKVQKWWNKYKTACKCDSLTMNLPNANILKFLLAQSRPEVLETLVLNYKIDINFIDPADGLNLLDFIIAEIKRYSKMPNGRGSVKIYEEYKATVIGLGGKSNKD